MAELAGNLATSDIPALVMSSRRRWAVTFGIMTGMFLAALEATVIGTAMPTVIASLGGLDHYSWVFSAYLITSTVTVPVWGKLSDLYGRRLFYQIGIGIFLVGSALSGMSSSMTELIIFRAIQGLGAGALLPLGMTIIGEIFTLKERAKMQAYFSGVWGLASVLGPIVGGFITDQLSWRWVFYINIPVGLAAALIMGFALKEPKRTARPVIDYAGAATLTGAITLLMLGLVEGGASIETLLAPLNIALFTGAVVLGVLFLRIEKKAVDPIVPLDMFRSRVVSVALLAGFLAGIGMFGSISFIPLFAQGALGSSATEAGSLLTPLMLSWVTVSVVGGRMMTRIGSRTMCIAGFTLMTLGFGLLANYGREMSRVWLYAELVLIGSGLGLTMLTLLISIQQSVPRARLGVGTSLNQFTRSIGGAIGVAVMGAVLSAGLASQIGAIESAGGGQGGGHLPTDPGALIQPEARAALTPPQIDALEGAMEAAMHDLFWVAAAIAGLAIVVSFRLPKELLPASRVTDPEEGLAH